MPAPHLSLHGCTQICAPAQTVILPVVMCLSHIIRSCLWLKVALKTVHIGHRAHATIPTDARVFLDDETLLANWCCGIVIMPVWCTRIICDA